MDTTDLCFICDAELNYNNRVQLTTTHTQLSNKSLPEIFAGVLGEEYFVVILNENDYACKNCASLLNRVDQLERDLKLVKNAVLTVVKKKHGVLVPDKDDQVVKVDKKDLSDESPPPKVSNPLKLNEPPNILINDINRGIEFLHIRHKPPQVQIPQQVPMPTHSNAIQPGESIISENATRILTPVVKVDKEDLNDERPPKVSTPLKLNKSPNILINNVKRKIEFAHVRHKPQQVPMLEQVPTPQQVRQKKMQLYRCQECNNRYYNRDQYVQHIQRDHKKSTLNNLEKQEE
ncbi:hypothetical protein AGLY_009330 [Aphis glycines]|uniref:C2H2-type domain-containing protein n=1 Tax=Aphis glycines TaxID=307491 RepID=A0A6G0TKB4_APHGL|nr:hypothetical protein AGLY_009330 [Aphis glycines]